MATVDLQTRFEFETATPAKFAEYHAANPKVYELLLKFAMEARHAGRRRLSINLLFERVRWYTAVETTGDPFKINNTFRAYYVRLLMQHVPELRGCFETRSAKADYEGLS